MKFFRQTKAVISQRVGNKTKHKITKKIANLLETERQRKTFLVSICVLSNARHENGIKIKPRGWWESEKEEEKSETIRAIELNPRGQRNFPCTVYHCSATFPDNALGERLENSPS